MSWDDERPVYYRHDDGQRSPAAVAVAGELWRLKDGRVGADVVDRDCYAVHFFRPDGECFLQVGGFATTREAEEGMWLIRANRLGVLLGMDAAATSGLGAPSASATPDPDPEPGASPPSAPKEAEDASATSDLRKRGEHR